MRKTRVVVTGGAGFIGSHLCDKLLRNGNDVICVDNLFTGSKDNIRHLLSNPFFEFIRHDITQPLFVECDQMAAEEVARRDALLSGTRREIYLLQTALPYAPRSE